jgi:hypothetical protein
MKKYLIYLIFIFTNTLVNSQVIINLNKTGEASNKGIFGKLENVNNIIITKEDFKGNKNKIEANKFAELIQIDLFPLNVATKEVIGII